MSTAAAAADSWELTAHTEADTERLGRTLARAVEAGTVVGLIGDLGAGKTRLVQAVAQELGVDRRTVNSPTFVLIQEYAGRLPIYHFDTYRLGGANEFLELGADEILSAAGVCLIEWADRVADVLPADCMTIQIEITGETTRRFRVRAGGPLSQRVLSRWRNELQQ